MRGGNSLAAAGRWGVWCRGSDSDGLGYAGLLLGTVPVQLARV